MARLHPVGDGGAGPRGRPHLARPPPLGYWLSGQGTSAGETFVRASMASLIRPFAARALLGACLLAAAAAPAAATKIDRVVSPAGIEIWLVQEPSVPLIAMDFAFRGGTSQDPADKAGVASMVAGLIDEGSGDLDSKTFHERAESKAIEISFSATRDLFSGSLRTLVENKDMAAELMHTSLTSPHFDAPDIE